MAHHGTNRSTVNPAHNIMTGLFIVFWIVMVVASIGWYGFLLFYIGFKGGREIREMTRILSERPENRRTNTQK